MKKNLLANLLCLICFGALASEKVPSSASRNDWALTSSAALDLPRYMGTWYEIAKYPNWFQKKCKEEARAEYSLLPDGKVQVINRCRLESGELNEAIGVGRQVGSARHLNSRFGSPRHGYRSCRQFGGIIGSSTWMRPISWLL